MCFGDNVVNRGCRYWLTLLHMVLTEVLIALENPGAEDIPFAAVSTLMSVLSSLVLSPAFVPVVITVTGAVCRGLSAAMLAAGPGDCGWHYFHMLR